MWIQSHGLFAQSVACFDGSVSGLHFTSELRSLRVETWHCISNLLVVFQCPLWDGATAAVDIGCLHNWTHWGWKRGIEPRLKGYVRARSWENLIHWWRKVWIPRVTQRGLLEGCYLLVSRWNLGTFFWWWSSAERRWDTHLVVTSEIYQYRKCEVVISGFG